MRKKTSVNIRQNEQILFLCFVFLFFTSRIAETQRNFFHFFS